MGHKINPLVFRSKIYPFYKNMWNSYKNNSTYLKTYFYTRHFIRSNLLNNILNLNIYYYSRKYLVFNFILKSKNIYYSEKKDLLNKLVNIYLNKNYTKYNYYSINFSFLINPLVSTDFLLNYIINKIQYSKVSLRKIIPYLIIFINYKYKIKGIKCIVSGRINGVQMAKSELYKSGKNSNQIKSCLVKYSFKDFSTKYGILGIKLWLFFN